MENHSHALIAGLFTLFLGAAVGVMLYLFGENKEDTRRILIISQQNVTGLNPQAQVRYRGIRAGKVLDIRLDEKDIGNILIEAEIARNIPLTQGTTARLSYQGVTGIAHVLLEDDGKNPKPLEEALPRLTIRPSTLDRMEEALPVMLTQAQEFLKSANALLTPENHRHLEKTLTQLEEASGRMNESIVQLQKLLSDSNVQKASDTLQESGALIQDARKMVAQWQAISSSLNDVLRTSDKNGELGKLIPQINKMTDELYMASRQVKQTLKMLEDSPQSLIFGVPDSPPGPGEKGFFAPPATPPALLTGE